VLDWLQFPQCCENDKQYFISKLNRDRNPLKHLNPFIVVVSLSQESNMLQIRIFEIVFLLGIACEANNTKILIYYFAKFDNF